MVEKEQIKACKIAGKLLEDGAKMVKPGVKLLDVAERIEKRTVEMGAKPAFPVNISRNKEAAHYTPKINDELVFSDGDIVKLDVGVHVNGYIGDTALTVDLSCDNQKLVKASEKALEELISMMKPGVNTAELGKKVESIIESYGFKTVRNLTGHMLKQWSLHTEGYSVPNTKIASGFKLEEGMVLALEPFATEGYGRVIENREVQIFGFQKEVPVRNRDARKLVEYAIANYKTLPFAERWLAPVTENSELKLRFALRELMTRNVFKNYPILYDSGGNVSQSEHTVVITHDGCEVLTLVR